MAIKIILSSVISTGILFAGFIMSANINEEKIDVRILQNKVRLIYYLINAIILCFASISLSSVFKTNDVCTNIRLTSLLSILSAIAYIDFEKHLIPNKMVLGALVIRIMFYCAELLTLREAFLDIFVKSIVALWIPIAFFVVGIVVKDSIGMGDIKALLVVSLFLGMPGAVSAAFASLVISFFAAVVLLIMKKKKRTDSIPFGPALYIGTLLSVLLTGM